MKNLIKRINQNFSSPKSFWIGVFMLSALLFIVINTLVSDRGFNQSMGIRNPTSALTMIIFCLPGFFLIAHGIKPKSKTGKIGAVLFKLYDLVFTWRR